MSTPRPATTRRANTRTAIMSAAENLIGDKGFASVTFADVREAAGQANKSVVQYHFGSRRGLVEAIVTARMASVNRRRQAALDELARTGRDDDLRAVVEALVLPLVAETLERPGSRYARFLVQSVFDPDLADIVRVALAGHSFRRVRELLHRNSPLPPETVARRVDAATVFLISCLAVHEAGERTAEATREIAADIVDVCVGMLTHASAAVPAGILGRR
jgi:AcrR family transcriptional regulator